MAYFTAVVARAGGSWRARDVDVEEAGDLEELADALRAVAATDDDPVVLVVEREDDWFALVRVDGEDDPRVFVSDAEEARESFFADVLGLDPEDEEASGPAGDLDVVADLGTGPDELEKLAGDDGPPTADAVAAVADRAGFGELLESLR